MNCEFDKKLSPRNIGQQTLNEKFKNMHKDFEDVKGINDLVYNEPTHLVSVFKDYLILDDINEFLKRPYTSEEQKVRLPKFC